MKNDKNKANSSLYDISLRLKSLRKQKKLTQKRLGELIGVTDTTISSYENDKAFPSPEVLIRLAEVLGVTTDQLLGVKEYPEELNPNITITDKILSPRQIEVINKFINDFLDTLWARY